MMPRRSAHRLRVKDLVERREIIVRDAKGGRDRVTVLPGSLLAPISEHLAKLFERFEGQRAVQAAVRTAIYTHVTGRGPWR